MQYLSDDSDTQSYADVWRGLLVACCRCIWHPRSSCVHCDCVLCSGSASLAFERILWQTRKNWAGQNNTCEVFTLQGWWKAHAWMDVQGRETRAGWVSFGPTNRQTYWSRPEQGNWSRFDICVSQLSRHWNVKLGWPHCGKGWLIRSPSWVHTKKKKKYVPGKNTSLCVEYADTNFFLCSCTWRFVWRCHCTQHGLGYAVQDARGPSVRNSVHILFGTWEKNKKHLPVCEVEMFLCLNACHSVYRKKEEESKRKLLENPIRMRQIQKMVSGRYSQCWQLVSFAATWTGM